MKYKAVYIQWRDATSIDSWQPECDALKDKAHLVHSVGWLVKCADDVCIIALNHDPEAGDISQYLIIPKPWCESIQYMTPGVS